MQKKQKGTDSKQLKKMQEEKERERKETIIVKQNTKWTLLEEGHGGMAIIHSLYKNEGTIHIIPAKLSDETKKKIAKRHRNTKNTTTRKSRKIFFPG